MIKVGLVGESPHDPAAIAGLLHQRFPGRFAFKELIRHIRGDHLEDPKTKHLLRKEFEWERPKIVIFIRDLDGPEDDKGQWAKRKAYHADFRSVVDRKSILLLNIQAIEAIVLADIQAFNSYYGAQAPQVEHPIQIAKPELELRKFAPYNEGNLAEICSRIDINTVLQRCPYFQRFIDELDQVAAALA